MKTVKSGTDVRRVDDHRAAHLVSQGWQYCPKDVWREQVRDVKKK